MQHIRTDKPAVTTNVRTVAVVVITASIIVLITLAGTTSSSFFQVRDPLLSQRAFEIPKYRVDEDKRGTAFNNEVKSFGKELNASKEFESRVADHRNDTFSDEELQTSVQVNPKTKEDNTKQSDYTREEKECIKRLPQAIIVGIQKCGTFALLKFLSIHPQIVACLDPGETKFFSQYYHKSLDWYKNLMPCSYQNQITMEKSPPYFYRAVCAKRIRKMNPETKIIIIVKDPIVRVESVYAMVQEIGHGGDTAFEDFVTTNNRTKVKTKSQVIRFSNYPKHTKAWIDNFGSEQILVVDGHKFEKEPAQELSKVERFLRIDSFFTPEKFVFNSTKGKYCFATEANSYECLGENKGRTHPKLSKDVQTLLQDYFRPLNKQFFKMVQREFDWGY